MRVHSSQKPTQAFTVTKCGNIAEIVFYTDIRAEEDGYSYEEARLCVPYRDNLKQCVEGDTQAWLKLAQTKREAPLTANEQIQRLISENALMSEALTQLIITVMEE